MTGCPARAAFFFCLYGISNSRLAFLCLMYIIMLMCYDIGCIYMIHEEMFFSCKEKKIRRETKGDRTVEDIQFSMQHMAKTVSIRSIQCTPFLSQVKYNKYSSNT